MKISYLLIVLSSLYFHKSLHANEAGNKTLDCGAVFTKENVFTYFPVLIKRERWEWYKIERTPERQEYAWIAEAGRYIDKKYVTNGVAFAISLGSANLENTRPEHGTLSDLIGKTNKNAYYSRKSLTPKDEDGNYSFASKSNVRAKQVSDGSISIYPADPETIKEVKRGNPTHMRLKAILPNEDESYECIVKIEHMELKR